ncbi:hypothetical protein KKA03_01490, partial [archaeon]|nr:hypothetical protein [archaeon]
DFIKTTKTRKFLFFIFVIFSNLFFIPLSMYPLLDNYYATGIIDVTVYLNDAMFLFFPSIVVAANSFWLLPFVGEYLDRDSITNLKKRGEKVPSYIP